jgi:hypothetical protein
MMLDNLQSVIERVIARSRDEADLQLIAAALQTGQFVLVIFLAEEAAIALERILQQWQPKQDQYVQPKGCQKRQECDRYLESCCNDWSVWGVQKSLEMKSTRGDASTTSPEWLILSQD